jgi:hypothetical protein
MTYSTTYKCEPCGADVESIFNEESLKKNGIDVKTTSPEEIQRQIDNFGLYLCSDCNRAELEGEAIDDLYYVAMNSTPLLSTDFDLLTL